MQRFSKEFLPRLCDFMREQAKLSAKSFDNADSTYIYTQAFKLQSTILSHIDKWSILFDIKQIELEHLIEATIIPYLNVKQPKKLQSQAVTALVNCSLLDADIVWLCLHYIIQFSSKSGEKLVYSTNIKLKYNFELNANVEKDLVDLFIHL
jgi:hypothetical protein